MIEITSETIERVETLLAGVPKGAERAFSNAINRGLSHTKTQAFKQVKKVYAVKQEALTAATKTQIRKASTGNLAGYVSFSGVKIPLYKFSVSPKEPGKKQKVRAGVMKGGGAVFEDAFIARMSNGHTGIFERLTSKRFPIEEKMGLSAAQMVGNEANIELLTQEAQEKVDERLKHEIDRILNGYGG
jgi:hypothetical protein